MKHVDFELHRFLYNSNQFGIFTVIPFNYFIFTAAEITTAVRNNESG